MSTSHPLPAWKEIVQIRPEVLVPNAANYAVHLGDVVRREPGCPDWMCQPAAFFEATYVGDSLRTLLEEVGHRLGGQPGNRVLQLRTPFGGGKTHSLVALYHAMSEPSKIPGVWGDFSAFSIEDGAVRFGVLSGLDFDPHEGARWGNGPMCRTLWGSLAWQIGGAEGWERIQRHDAERVAPGGDLLRALLEGKPTLILLDELLLYIEKTRAMSLGDSNFGRQNLLFLQTLTETVRSLAVGVLVYTLQSTTREAVGEAELLATLDQLANRLDARRQPLREEEWGLVLRKRLFSEVGAAALHLEVAEAYAQALRSWMLSMDDSTTGKRRATRKANQLRARIPQTYPFHPDLVSLFATHWSSLASFQRTRGALQLMSQALPVLLEQPSSSGLLGVGDLPLEQEEWRRRLCAQLGIDPLKTPAFAADLLGDSATATRLDALASERADEEQWSAARLAKTTFFYSFGGATSGELGVAEKELFGACVAPEVSPLALESSWRALLREAHFLHAQQERFVFTQQPNLNRWIVEESERIEPARVWDMLRQTIEEEKEKEIRAVVWPETSREIPDHEFRLTLAFVSPFQSQGAEEKELLDSWLETRGAQARQFRNALVVAWPQRSRLRQVEQTIRRCLAIQQLITGAAQLGISEAQRAHLELRLERGKAEFFRELPSLYDRLSIPQQDSSQGQNYRWETLELGPLVLQQKSLLGRYKEALLQRYFVSEELAPSKVVRLLRESFGDSAPVSLCRWATSFFSFFSFPRVFSRGVLRKALLQGAEEGVLELLRQNETGGWEPLDVEELASLSTHRLWHDTFALRLPQAEETKAKAATERVASPKRFDKQALAQGSLVWSCEVDASQWKALSSVLSHVKRKSKRMHVRIEVEAEVETANSARWYALQVEDPLLDAGIQVKRIKREKHALTSDESDER